MRIALAGILHETSTLVDTPTTMTDFERDHGIFRGEDLLDRFRGANICIGGFIDAAQRCGFEPVPLLSTSAHPGGRIHRQDYEDLRDEILQRLRDADLLVRLDGILLQMHGAMVADGIDDADGDMIDAVRHAVEDRPVVVTTDLHSNHTPLRMAAADAIVGYDTYPHVDMNERGQEAASIIARTVRGEIKPTMAMHQLPLFWNYRCQMTSHPTMDEVLRRIHDLQRRPGVVCACVATSFP